MPQRLSPPLSLCLSVIWALGKPKPKVQVFRCSGFQLRTGRKWGCPSCLSVSQSTRNKAEQSGTKRKLFADAANANARLLVLYDVLQRGRRQRYRYRYSYSYRSLVPYSYWLEILYIGVLEDPSPVAHVGSMFSFTINGCNMNVARLESTYLP